MESNLKSWLDAGLGFFYPPVCQLCQCETATAETGYVGVKCRRRIRFIRPPWCERCGLPAAGHITTRFVCSNCRGMRLQFRSARAAVAAQGPILEIIHRYKYHRALWFEPLLARLLIHAAGPVLAREQWDYLVPVPLHPVRRREREFNQAERLAARLSRASGIPMDNRLLKRVKYTATQTQLSREERRRNIGRAFAVRQGKGCRRARIVLVDDVLTTGATTSGCATVLKQAGARDVCVWTVARGL